jgi:hypothetical protein
MPHTTALPQQSAFVRAFLALPVIGHIIRDTARDVDMVFYYLVIFATTMVLAVQTWGLAALVVTMVALVPVIFILLIWMTLP